MSDRAEAIQLLNGKFDELRKDFDSVAWDLVEQCKKSPELVPVEKCLGILEQMIFNIRERI